eukprot:m.195477 g.195477  ORF g.195477 m.195477 type:complete len:313 (+) comp19495_c0_seq1:79-1017(+)
MGLCKCRQVTTLFCFQCRINVCDKCIVTKHKTCVVNQYMQWLLNSEFDPTCRLCTGQFSPDQETIRLGCLHVFHKQCLLDYAASLPANTAPAGYACPKCQAPIMPSASATDAVSAECRRELADVPWARMAAAGSGGGGAAGAGAVTASGAGSESSNVVGGIASAAAALVGSGASGDGMPGAYGERVTARKPHVSIAVPSPPNANAQASVSGGGVPDPDDNKYARRSVNERFNRVVANQLEESARRGSVLRGTSTSDGTNAAGLRRTAIVFLIIMIVAVTAIELLTRAKSGGEHGVHHDIVLSRDHDADIRTG